MRPFVLLIVLALLQPSPLRTVGKGPMSGIDTARHVVVRTAAEWTALWHLHAPDTLPPTIDFSREMAIGVFLGTRPTAGYGVEIVRTGRANGGLVVEYVETAPKRDAITAQVLTAPYHLVTIPLGAGDVRFEKVEK